MRLPKSVSTYNPLDQILGLFTYTFEDLSLDNLQDTAELLSKGGILCEEYHEIFTCLQVLEELKLLELEELLDKKTGYTSYKIRKTL